MIHGIISVIGQAASSADGGISITGLTIGGAALTTLGGLVGAWLKAHTQALKKNTGAARPLNAPGKPYRYRAL